MTIKDNTIPVVVLNCKLGGLSIMRSLGSKGVRLYGVDADRHSPAMTSRYCRRKFLMDLDEKHPEYLLDYMLEISDDIGCPAILIPTSDETSVFVAQYQGALSKHYLFPKNTPELVRQLMDKKGMYELALKHKIPTPHTTFPRNLGEVEVYSKTARFPVMLKGILGNRLQQRTGKKMVLVSSAVELIKNYQWLEDPEQPNLMLQEVIPGGDDEVFIFNGYFDENSNCLSPYTGHKIRQFPIHVGCASLGACVWNEEVAGLTMSFMKAVGYRGILDIGYRYDARDGLYKVLDINPRVGQAFRMFVGRDDMDVVRDLYLDLTGQSRTMTAPRNGRRWIIEDFDLISSWDYYREGSMTFGQWLKSFRGLREGLWFNWKDPWPFVRMSFRLLRQFSKSIFRRLGSVSSENAPVAAQKIPGM